MSAPILQLDAITKSFGAVRALQGVSFDLLPGEVHALLGENGAGKSTLIKIVTGAHAPDQGSLTVLGHAVRHLSPAAAHHLGIACIYQQPALFADLTVAENIALRLEPVRPFHRVRWSAHRHRAQALLDRIGAHIPPETEVRTLSMPEQQLVEMACVVGSNARIVIMDEPSACLTRREQDRLFAIVRQLRSGGVGIVYISHRLEEIFALANRVTVLRDGRSVGTRPIPRPDLPAPAPDTPPVSESELIGLMVGREWSHLFPPPEGVPGDVALSLRKVSCPAAGIHEIDLDLRAGEILGLAGLIGAGRTELARTLFGLTPVESGQLLLHGRPVRIRSPRDAVAHGIAYVPEDRRRHGVILDLPVAHNLTLAIHPRLFPGTWLRRHAERRLALESIRHLAIRTSGPDAPVATLSGGNQQKVALGRWLATHPRILILDEPTQGVDVGAKSEIHRLIRQLALDGLAVLMISSDLPEILGMSDRIAVMRAGRLVTTLPAQSSAHDVMAAALGQTGGNP